MSEPIARARSLRLAMTGILLAALLATLGLTARAEAAPLSPANEAFVNSTVEASMTKEKTPGLSIQISGPAGEFSKAYGWGQMGFTLNHMILANHVRIGSITKTFTATAILQQIEKGNLKFSDKLSEFITGIKYGNEITVRQLLAMQSGVYEFENDEAFKLSVGANPSQEWNPEKTVEIIRKHEPEYKPGEYTHYNESNYALLGVILEKVTGESAEAAIQKSVINPLGLTQTSLPAPTAAEPNPTKLPEPFAHGYNRYFLGLPTDTTPFNARIPWTMGGMVSTVGDLATWGQDLGTGALLSPSMFAERTQFCSLGAWSYGGASEFGYGLGLMSLGNWIGHSGSWTGFSTSVFYEPKTGAVISVVENLQSPKVAAWTDVLNKVAQQLYPGSMETPKYPKSPTCPPPK